MQCKTAEAFFFFLSKKKGEKGGRGGSGRRKSLKGLFGYYWEGGVGDGVKKKMMYFFVEF